MSLSARLTHCGSVKFKGHGPFYIKIYCREAKHLPSAPGILRGGSREGRGGGGGVLEVRFILGGVLVLNSYPDPPPFSKSCIRHCLTQTFNGGLRGGGGCRRGLPLSEILYPPLILVNSPNHRWSPPGLELGLQGKRLC